MPAHNPGKYLANSVKSILQQTHENLELIIIDDNCDDHSIEQLDKGDKRLRIISNNGKGIVEALNTGIKFSTGTFIARMDTDDIAINNRIATQLNYLKQHPDIHICGTQVELFRDDTQLGGGYQHYQQWINGLTHKDDIANNIFIESPIPHPSVMMSRQHWLSLGGYQDAAWPEDYDLWLRAYLNGYEFGKPQGILLRWRDHDQRLSRQSERYNKKAFIKAKAHYLIRLYTDRQFRIWGSGPTGAILHDEILKNGGKIIDFIDIAAKKIGGQKRNKPIVSAFELQKSNALILLAVSARGAREDIIHFLDQQGFIQGRDYLCAA